MKHASLIAFMLALFGSICAEAQPCRDDGYGRDGSTTGDYTSDAEWEQQRARLRNPRTAAQYVADLEAMIENKDRAYIHRYGYVEFFPRGNKCNQINGAGVNVKERSLSVAGVMIYERDLAQYPLFRTVFYQMLEHAGTVKPKG
jgi:hypothetical protein